MNASIWQASRLVGFSPVYWVVIFCLGCSTTFEMDEEPLDSGITFEPGQSVSIYTVDKRVLRMSGQQFSAKKIDGKLLVIDGGTINGRFAAFDLGEVARIMKGDKKPTGGNDFLTGYLCFVTLGFSGCGIADRDINRGYSVIYHYPVTQDDYRIALKWYQQAAQRSDPIAMATLGDLYAEGRGVAADKKAALRWYELAVAHGITEIQLGSGFQQIKAEQETRQLHIKAEQGDARAQSRLGWLYQTGRGVTRNYKTAIAWYRLAAEQGNAQAQFRLGWMYQTGHGVARDYEAAIAWYRLAAGQGHADAQHNLDAIYLEGRDVIQDRDSNG